MFDLFLRKIPLWFFAAAILCLHPALFAQDEDGWSGFSSFGFPGGPADGGFAPDSFSGSPFSFALETEMTARAMLGGGYLDGYFHDSRGGDSVFLDPSAKLDFGYASEKTDFRLVLRADRDVLAFWPQDIIGEFTARAYLGDFVLEAGKMKIVWGKGDEVHVVDNFNANDYTNFIFPSYIDRRIAEPMLRGLERRQFARRSRLHAGDDGGPFRGRRPVGSRPGPRPFRTCVFRRSGAGECGP